MIKKTASYFGITQQRLHALLQWKTLDLKYKYLSYGQLLSNFYKNRNAAYNVFSLSDLRSRKKSDTLFILGCNRNINDIPDSIWSEMGNFDSLGFNYWIYHKFVPTYYSLEYGQNKHIHEFHKQLIRNRAADYKNTIFLVSTRARRRGMTPRLIPDYFPPNPNVAYFLYPMIANNSESKPFTPEDFQKTMLFRGSLNVYLYFARLMGFKKIILVGCEMDSSVAFYEDYPEAQWMFNIDGFIKPKEERAKILYGGAYSVHGKHSVVNIILAINEFVFKPEGIKLYVFNKKSLLYPKVPLFKF